MISLPEFGYLEAGSRLEIPTINKQGMYLEYQWISVTLAPPLVSKTVENKGGAKVRLWRNIVEQISDCRKQGGG